MNMKKILILTLLGILLNFTNLSAGTDGENTLSNNNTKQVKDCFEGLNRGIFAFNQGLDKAIFKPVSKVYRHLPNPIKLGTSNVISNLSNLVTVPNNILQGDFATAGKNTARLLINSTVGVLGLFDVAASAGFNDYKKEDYGQTLGAWGVGEGCYVVLPVLGPSTVRDVTGSLASILGGDAWYNITVGNDTQYVNEADYYVSRITSAVDFRAKNINSLENLEKNSIDFYASVKSLYLQDRKQKILNSNKIIDTLNDSDWEEIKTN